MGNDYILGVALAVCFGSMSFLIRKILKQRPGGDFFSAFVVLQGAKFIVMATVLFMTLHFFSGNSFVFLCSFLAAFTFIKFIEVYKIYRESLRAA